MKDDVVLVAGGRGFFEGVQTGLRRALKYYAGLPE